MSGLTMLLISTVVLLAGYFIYGRYLQNKWGIDKNARTPAYEMEDGVDYVPADTSIVFGHQFASIAGAGPINGPIVASMFGWLPVLLWILFGGIFFGAVQDFVAMYASVKNKGRSIGYIIELYIGKTGKKLFLLFVWLFSILVVAAFADIVAKTFDGFDAQGSTVYSNGAVASTSMIFIVFAVGLGFLLKYANLNKWLNTGIAIILLVASIALGLYFPIYFGLNSWLIFVFLYIMVASVTPVWALLQPRDYLNSYLLLAMMLCSMVGIIFARPSMNLAAFNGFHINGQYLFPILFVTIACGAVSGFHALVSSGTASKQIKNEKSMLPVSFGAMLLECFLAVIALIAVGSIALDDPILSGTQPQIFAAAIASFLTKLGIHEDTSKTLITLAISAFALTSLDSVARVGRLSFQEFFLEDDIAPKDYSLFRKAVTNKYVATIATLLLAYLLSQVGYASIWPLFGSANQLLSALALIACAVFLKKTKRQGAMLWGPMIIMLGVTFSALTLKIKDLILKLADNGVTFNTSETTKQFIVMQDGLQLVFGVLLFILGIIVAYKGINKLFSKEDAKEKATVFDM